MLTSYAQNFEDVILWRALKHVDRGFYIDIGAHDPVVDSVSLAFYEKGWRGAHVEPRAAYAEKLRQARPDETVIQAAIGINSGTIPFWEFPDGLSTGDPAIAAMHKRDNRRSVRIEVPCMPMSRLLSNYSDRDIHWLKIDVEGMERAVIQSWPPAKTRPWIVLVESTKPNSREPTFVNWEPLLIALCYEFVYFDGLNRFYVSREHLELKTHFGPGPNCFDDFVLSGYASAPFCARINAELANLREQAAHRANDVGNTSGASRRLLQGALAWLNLRPGSIPRRVVRRGIVAVGRFLLARPRLGQMAKLLLRRFPAIEARLRTMLSRMPAQNFVQHHPKVEIRSHLPRRARRIYAELKAQIERGEGRERAVTGLRPKLAYISPLPPEPSGIADYSAELLPELSQHFEIDVVIAQRGVSDPYITAAFPIRTVDWFRNHADKYDRVLYHFGNNIFHQHMFGLLEEIPGVVVLHDFFLSHLIAYMDSHGSFPNGWVWELYTSHGYEAVWRRFRAKDPDDIIWRYPCNLSVLRYAQGIIVHSANSLCLAKQWYGAGADPTNWAVIPFPRTSRIGQNKMAARAALGFGASDFLVCTFGYLVPTKHNHRLLHAWLKSRLARDRTCHLIFVGESDGGTYGRELRATIHDNLAEGDVRITGWVDADVFRQYLAAADIGIQLRTLSRGETSAAVFDCMNYGLASIVNANGSMADLDGDAVWKLPDDFTDAQLIGALETLWKDAQLRAKFGARAREIILEKHNPCTCAAQYHAAIERFYTSVASRTRALTSAIAGIEHTPDDDELIEIAEAVARSAPPRGRQLLLDVSKTCCSELTSGIESAARALILIFLERPPEGFRVEPVYLSSEGGTWHYRYARRFTLNLFACPPDALADDAVDVQAGDVLLGLDNSAHRLIEGEAASLLADYRSRGVAVYSTVNDVLHAALASACGASSGR